jgi:DNA-binding SARP family transcriptional activator/nucleotide-binding universal stress UspA family protein
VEAGSASLEFRILGPVEVLEGDVVRPVVGAGQRALLAALLLHANEVVSSDRLIEELWPQEPPRSGLTALRVRVSQLRKTLGAGGERLETTPPGYRLRLAPGELDLDRFSHLVEEAADAEPGVAAERLREALALWRGAPLADVAYESFARPAIRRLEELRLLALERRINADLALGRHLELVGEIEVLIAEHPLREHLRAQLMIALYRSGRQAEALEAYEAARRVLVEQLGLDPSPTLRQLETAILRQDPALDFAPRERDQSVVKAPQRSLLVVPQAGGNLGWLLALAEPLARRPLRELILARIVLEEQDLTEAAGLLAKWRTELLARHVAVRAAAFTSADPGEEIVRLTSEQEVDLLLLDAPRALLAEGLPCSDTVAVLERVPCDVGLLVVRGTEAPAFAAARPILVPFGGGENDWAALEIGAWIAAAVDAPLTVLGPTADPGRGKRDASRLLATVSLMVQQVTGVAAEPLLLEPGADRVIETAAEAGLLVVGLSGAWRKEGLGSVRRTLAREARTPTLLVRGGLRPGGLAPRESLTRFSWSLTGEPV